MIPGEQQSFVGMMKAHVPGGVTWGGQGVDVTGGAGVDVAIDHPAIGLVPVHGLFGHHRQRVARLVGQLDRAVLPQ